MENLDYMNVLNVFWNAHLRILYIVCVENDFC